ncbi:MAG: DUF3426 domain-containing protein [Anaerolineae bacterium]|nr:DUF3426 domain-containing protein [Anaerolineae bacterium]
MRRLWIVFVLILAGCGSGAVVFAPTPLPPDLSPLRYEHPSGAFSVVVPRTWATFSQHATTLAATSFAPPDSPVPLLTLAVINLGQPLDTAAFNALLNQYQQDLRPDASRYKEESRQAMGDGSWRMTGLRALPGGGTQPINTFIEREGSLIGLVEAAVPDDPALADALQTTINTFHINPEASLEATDPSVLVSLAATSVGVLNVATWTTPSGVFYITGEVANYGTSPLKEVPVQAVLLTPDGLAVAEAEDLPMGYAVLPGGFAPFSLRFGQGQPALAARYSLTFGSAEPPSDSSTEVYGPTDLSWIDESTYDAEGQLVVSGMVTNIGDRMLHRPRATVTVFDANQNVVAARFADLPVDALGPNESAPFELVLSEIGAEPAQYVVNIQALP